jgi:hypothetical protein
MKTYRKLILLAAIFVFMVAAVGNSACAAGKTPAAVAANVAHNGTILVDVVDKVQDFVIAQEAAGTIPRNQAVTAMEGIGRALDAAKRVPGNLDKLAQLSDGSSEEQTVLTQIRDALTIISTEVGQALIPIESAEMRKQIGALAAEVNKTIGIVLGWVLEVR